MFRPARLRSVPRPEDSVDAEKFKIRIHPINREKKNAEFASQGKEYRADNRLDVAQIGELKRDLAS
jgi:hypothetical protein